MTPQKSSYPKNIEIQNVNKKNGPSLGMYENIRVTPPPPGGKQTEGPKVRNLHSQIWKFKHLFLFGTSHKSAC